MPADPPDLDTAHESLLLVEQYREASRLRFEGRPEELRQLFKEAEEHATALEKLFRGGQTAGLVDMQQVETAFTQVQSACANCHTKYRDAPR